MSSIRHWLSASVFIILLSIGWGSFALDTMFPATKNEPIPSAHWLPQKKPAPTNAWFTNFILDIDDKKWSEPVNVFPYLVRVGIKGIGVSYPSPIYYKEPAYPKVISALYYQFIGQFILGSKELLIHYAVESYHGLAVDLAWANDSGQKIKAAVFQGSPYLSLYYSNTTPQLSSRFKWLTINNKKQTGLADNESRYELRLAVDDKHTQTWILYSEKPLKMMWSTSVQGEELSATEPYTGWIRLVLQNDTQQGVNNDPSVLDAHAAAIPINYSQTYNSSAKHLMYSFRWQTTNNKAPLMLSLPHQRINNSLKTNSISYKGIKGLLLGTTESQWEIELPLIPIRFLQPKSISPQLRIILHNTLLAESKQTILSPIEDGPYFRGKKYARIARLMLIAHYLGEQEIVNQLSLYIKDSLTAVMLGKAKWYFQYDATWGGIIPSIDDYGARHYNDHHYHYGYWVYTFSVLAELDKSWFNTPLKSKQFTPKQWIEQLILDYASPEHSVSYPMQRYQDDYSGHSWASGITASVDGQNEQSSSEAVNAYYALALYGQATKNHHLFSWGQFLMTRELVSAQFYWQINKENSVYSDEYKKYNQVVGNLWASKVDSDAFFIPCVAEYRCGLQYSFGIQMLPFTEISPYLLRNEWLLTAYPTIKKLISGQYGPITDPWKWILIKGVYPAMNQNEQPYFFQRALLSDINEYDSGDSKTNTLYYLSK